MESNIKTVEDAFAYTGRDLAALEAFKSLPESDRSYQEATYKRMVVIEALNKEANKGKNWTPDWDNGKWDKYYSWAWLKKNPAVAGVGFVVRDANFDGTRTRMRVSARAFASNHPIWWNISTASSRICCRS